MADFKKGSYEFNLPTTTGGQLALRHRKVIKAGLTPTVNIISNNFTIYDEDAGITNDQSDSNTYVTAFVFLHAPAILDCFVQTGVIESTSQSSIIPAGLNTTNVEFISNTSWNIKFSYAGKNFVISPLTGNTITCKSASLYRHTITLSNSSVSSNIKYNIIFDIINSYGKPYTNFDEVKATIKSLYNNNSFITIRFPCSGYYCDTTSSPTDYYPYGDDNGFVTNIVYTNFNNIDNLTCEVPALYKNPNGAYQYLTRFPKLSSSSVSDTVYILS